MRFLAGDCDTGIAQIDALQLDEAATVWAAAEFHSTFGQRTKAEAALLREHEVKVVIADAPPLACAAAASVGVPSIVMGNFTWDWIYEEYLERFRADAPEVLPLIREAYRNAREAWRIPMHGGFDTVASVIDLPFVARHAGRARAMVLEALQISAARPLALLSFGGYGVEGLDLERLDCLEQWTIVVTGKTAPASLPAGAAFVNEGYLYDRGMRYEDLVGAVDVVVSKPGYGIISECVANHTALLYTSRGRFREYDVMVHEMPRVLRCAHLAQEALLAGRWRAALDDLLASPPPPERPATNGAELAAARILELLQRL